MVQWLGLCALTAECPGSIPGLGTKIPQAKTQPKKKKNWMESLKKSGHTDPGPRWEVRTSNTSKLEGAQHPPHPTPFPHFPQGRDGDMEAQATQASISLISPAALSHPLNSVPNKLVKGLQPDYISSLLLHVQG